MALIKQFESDIILKYLNIWLGKMLYLQELAMFDSIVYTSKCVTFKREVLPLIIKFAHEFIIDNANTDIEDICIAIRIIYLFRPT